ncbi:MAG: aminotransferase class I/II-fold pyridoxal phosphate-dependent enzyme [Planctomycetota bacterium]|nr:aminotransferase class I/II-fold pyridoxal phosphate-dependent enzyme [Planctomycetota bacterium]
MPSSVTPSASQTSRSLLPFGESIFARMSRLANECDAINLGQGFPNFDAPAFLRDRVAHALCGPTGQYSRSAGLPALCQAISSSSAHRLGYEADWQREIVVTAGATEGIAAAILGLVNPGDEVILIDPGYDSYAACVALAGAIAVRVPLDLNDFSLPRERLAQAFSSRTRMVIVNSPHNPSGRVFTVDELSHIAKLACAHSALVLSDEVYEHLVFDGDAVSISTLPGMRERTIVLSSLGKTFSCTGWKVGWAIAPEPLAQGVLAAHQFLTFCAPSPLQGAAVEAIRALAPGTEYLRGFLSDYRARLDALAAPLEAASIEVRRPEGTYFMLMRTNTLAPGMNELQAAEHLARTAGVATIPLSPFCAPGAPEGGWLRLAYCKEIPTLQVAAARLTQAAKRLCNS